MRTVRAFLAGAVTFGAAAVAVACGNDFSTQPAATSQVAMRSIKPSPLGGKAQYIPASSYTTTVRFTIDPYNDTYVQIGPHYLYIPRGAVCDQYTSGYGLAWWDIPCRSTSKSITVTAKASLDQNGHPLVEFDTPLRFRPDNDDKYGVMLYLRDDNASSKSVITWCESTGRTCVDEVLSLLTAKFYTRWDSQAKYVYRMIEHFSGYNVTGGRNCDPSDPSCQVGAQ